jgi:hypothetical protein
MVLTSENFLPGVSRDDETSIVALRVCFCVCLCVSVCVCVQTGVLLRIPPCVMSVVR